MLWPKCFPLWLSSSPPLPQRGAKSKPVRPGPDSGLTNTTNLLCSLKPLAHPLWALVFSSVTLVWNGLNILFPLEGSCSWDPISGPWQPAGPGVSKASLQL